MSNDKHEEEVEEPEIAADEESVEETPDVKPKSVSAQIKERLLEGATKEELVDEGYNPNSIRTIASNLKSEYGREFGKEHPGKAVATRGLGGMTTPPKGMPLEQLINLLQLPTGDHKVLEKGIQFGMEIVVLGVRVAQELSAIGVQQAKPLVEMARDMRAGETAAAKTAAGEAAMGAAAAIHSDLAPVLAQMLDAQRSQAAASTEAARTKMGNPMQDMMMEAVRPQFQNAINRMMGTLTGGAAGAPGAAQPTEPDLPAGWVRKEEE